MGRKRPETPEAPTKNGEESVQSSKLIKPQGGHGDPRDLTKDLDEFLRVGEFSFLVLPAFCEKTSRT